MPHTRPAKIPPPPPQVIILAKLALKRFSIALLSLVALLILIAGQVNAPLAANARMRLIDQLLPAMQALSLPVDYVITTGERIQSLLVLQKENSRLQEENQQLKQFYALSRHIQMENEELRRLLHVIKEPPTSFITARVVGDVSGPYVRSALINAGTRHGVKQGQIVINQQGVVGRIVETGEKTARVLLLTDLNSKIPAITSESRERCIAAGDNSEVINILYLPDDNKVHVGEQVFTSGDGNMFPPDLLIGTVYAMKDNAYSIKPAVEWNRLGYVQVVTEE